jgi:hypothetical protein
VRVSLSLCAVLSSLWAAFSANAEPRIALIIGNSDYAAARLKLDNPVNDAAAMQRALRAAGFETIDRGDRGDREMTRGPSSDNRLIAEEVDRHGRRR